jgi:putative ABC transport system substrate-binding protein
MKRREFIALFGGAATAWPLGARAQQSDRVRRIGVLLNFQETDQEGQARVDAFRESLRELGWSEGRNFKIEYRWSPGDAAQTRTFVAELLGLGLDVIVTNSNAAIVALRRATQTQPVVFTTSVDPVASGFVTSLAHPGGNMTGFTQYESSMGGKWLDLLKETAPHVDDVLVLVSPENTISPIMVRSIEAAAQRIGVQVTSAGERDAAGFERALNGFARGSNRGVIVIPNAPAYNHRQLIVDLTAKFRLPALYFSPTFVAAGGLMSYGNDPTDPFRRMAGYVDRILRGEKSGDLPVQAPTKFNLVINLKTAKALGLTVPPMIVYRADEVIE